MKLSAFLVVTAGCASAFSPATKGRASIPLAETKNDLEVMAKKLNPLVGYYDPLNLVDAAFWGKSDDFTIGWLRQAEVKHGRVAMAAFVGYCVQSNVHWPWAMTLDGSAFPDTSLSPPAQWDALPFASKLQIVLFVGFLEFYSELTPGEGTESGQTHYTKGGVIGKFPTFDAIPHPVPFNLYDPFGFNKNMSEETKERRLRAEINNGRLAMLGIFGFLSAQTIPGSVPALSNIVQPYTGNIMGPFCTDFSSVCDKF